MNLSFIIIGAQKAATTFVQRGLVDHPEVCIPDLESDVLIYNQEKNSVTNIISNLFQGLPKRPTMGLKSADYLGHSEIAPDVSRIFPDVKIVAILRDPVSRAFSAYHHLIRYGFFPGVEPEQGLSKIFSGEWDSKYPAAKQVRSYGEYGRHLQKWFAAAGEKNLLVLEQEKLLKNKEEGMRSLYQFLEVDAEHRSENLDKRSQAVTYHLGRLRWLSLGGKLRRLLEKRRSNGVIDAGFLTFFVHLSWVGVTAVDRLLLVRIFGNKKCRISDQLTNTIDSYYKKDRELLDELRVQFESSFVKLDGSNRR